MNTQNQLTPSQWLVLDNLKNNWPYTTNLSIENAHSAYLWAVSNEYIRDGELTESGLGRLMSCPSPRKTNERP